jgi:signal transduction histidine kinase
VLDADGAITHYVAIQEDITERKRIEEAEREQRTLISALRETAAALTSTLDLAEVLERILASLARVVPHDAADLMLLENGEVRIVRTHGNAPEAQDNVLGLHLPIDRPSNVRTMLLTGQPLIIKDVHQDPDWVFAAGTEWMRAYVGTPIQVEGETIGFLSLASATPGFFTETHAQSLQALAEHAAIALRNASLYKALEARNAELDEFGHTVAHDLRSPLAGIVGYLAVLDEMEGDRLSEHGRGLLGEAQRSANKMDEIIHTLLLLARLHSVEETISPVDMRGVIEAALARCRQDIATRGIKVITGEDLPQVLGYGPWLEEVFTNLIQNAVKYMGWSNPDPRITLQARTQDDQEHLFERFTRFHKSLAPGSGLGLSIVHRIITRLGGQLGVESEPGKGSTFWFSLPAA